MKKHDDDNNIFILLPDKSSVTTMIAIPVRSNLIFKVIKNNAASAAVVRCSPYFVTSRRMMATKITDGVEFDTIAREWRCKWSADDDKKSLAEAQTALNSVLDQIKSVDGFKKVDRVVCGGNLDFKVITSLPAGEKFEAWASTDFEPETNFLDQLSKIDGITKIETQTYTIMPM